MKGWGASNRSRDLDVIRGWAEKYPNANVAICADENIVILESDDLAALEQAMLNGAGKGLPMTATAYGSSPNRPHFFFKRTKAADNVGNLAVPGLFEARFSNQYVVGPGSVHPSGAVYQWHLAVPPIPIPDWLVSELARLALKQKEHTTVRNIQMTGGKVTEGSRHYFLMREGGRMWNGKITEDEFITAMRELNENYCEPPKPDAHVLECVRDIMQREPFDPGPKPLIGGKSSGEPVAEVADEWQSLSADELVALEVEERQPVLTEGEQKAILFYERSVNQILAWRGVGKTNFALGLAGALAAGGSILDFTAGKPRRVLYLDGELPLAQLQERVRGFVKPEFRHNVQLFSPEMLPAPRTLNLLSNRDFDAMMRLIDRHKTEVVFLDSQSTLMGGDSTKDEYQEARMQMLRQMRWRDLCIVEMHHVGKQGLQRGLSKNDDILDVQMSLKRLPDWEPEDKLAFEVVYDKVRHAASLDSGYKVTLVEGQWTKGATDLVAQVADLINNQKATVREIAKKLKISDSRVGRLRQKAVKAGLLHADKNIEVHIGG